MLTKQACVQILQTLLGSLPPPTTELIYRNPFELLIATMLAAQCTDKRVNMVTPTLFAAYPTPRAMAEAEIPEIEHLIRSINFFRNKAAHAQAAAQLLCDEFGGEVPRTLEELVRLPGVGRKTASVVLSTAFRIPALAVDTHVHRVTNRMGMVSEPTPEKTEWALRKKLPEEWWIDGHHLLILHGRYVCAARAPKCGGCAVRDLCQWKEKRNI